MSRLKAVAVVVVVAACALCVGGCSTDNDTGTCEICCTVGSQSACRTYEGLTRADCEDVAAESAYCTVRSWH